MLVHKEKKLCDILQDFHLEFVLNINMAFLVQQKWKEATDRETNYSFIGKAIKSLKQLYEDISIESETYLLQRIRLEFSLSKSYLQLAASYSQFFIHQKALKSAKKALKNLNLLINNLQNLLQEKSFSLDLSFDRNSENSRVIHQTPELKENFLAFIQPCKIIIDSIEILLKNLESNNLDFQFKDYFKDFSKISAVDFVAKTETPWMHEISITNFMHVEYVSYSVITSKIQFEELYNDSFLAFTIMLSSIVLFTISTENRFLLLDSISSSKGAPFKIKPVFEKTHQQQIRKMKRFVFSEKVHSKSIYLLQHFLKESSLHNHLINSYKKNYEYRKTLEEIVILKA